VLRKILKSPPSILNNILIFRCYYCSIKGEVRSLSMKMINLKYLLTCLILILCLLVGSSCLLPPTGTSSPETQTPAQSTITPSTSVTAAEPGWTLPAVKSENLALPSFADVVAEIKPSVVAVNTEVITYDIFNRSFTQEGAGSGWIIDKDGYIVTNNHVVEGANSITVTLADGRTLPAQKVYADAYSDLAIVKIDAQNLTAASVGDSSQLRVGDWVMAIGNPLGLGISAKEGIVSRLGVSLEISAGQTMYDLIETSAAINPGNSGGPLVNMAGEVIGITSIKISTSGVEGMGYAISINNAVPVIKELIQKGYIVRPSLGLTLYTVDQYVLFRYRLAVNKGAFVTQVDAGSPADKAGIKPGDVITGFNDKEITTAEELNQAIYSSQIGQQVKVSYWRGSTQNTIYATPVESLPP
jgi:serine protease Do